MSVRRLVGGLVGLSVIISQKFHTMVLSGDLLYSLSNNVLNSFGKDFVSRVSGSKLHIFAGSAYLLYSKL